MTDPQQIVSQLHLSAEEEFQLHLERGRKSLNAGNLIEAKAEIDRCLRARPNDSSALNLRALLLFKLEEYDDAIAIFEELVLRFPDEAVLRNSLGLAYLKKNDFQGAVPHFERAVEIDRTYNKARNYLGFCYQNLERYEEARDEFLLAGARSMAAKMEELLAAQKPEEIIEDAEPVEANMQEAIDRMINEPEPEPERPDFASLERPEPPAPREEVRPAKSPVLARSMEELGAGLRMRFRSDAPCALSDDGVLRVRGQTFCRLAHSVCAVGSLEFRPRFKRYKGKDLKTHFGSESDPIHELVGEGILYVKPPGSLSILPLDDEVLYLAEDRLWAFAGDLRWENGRLPGEEGGDMLLVQLKGSGHAALHLHGPLTLLTLTPDLPTYLPADSVVGWFGEAVPRLATLAFPGHAEPTNVVELKGSGQALFELPRTDAPSGAGE
jgi:thioredoxin-like negative regulator of GroEL